MWRTSVLVVVLLSAVGCQPPSVVSSLHSVSVNLADDQSSIISDELDRAHRFAHASGIKELRDGLDRLAEAWARPGTPGGVLVVIEPTRFSDALNPIHTRPRTVRLSPGLVDGVTQYTLRIDSARFHRTISGPAELAVYLYAAALRREWYEAKGTSTRYGRALLDEIVGEPQGLLTVQFRTWERVIDQAYLPLRAANHIPPIPELEALAEARASCPRTPDPEGCWRWHVRAVLNLKEPQ
ncbi:MAG: hypothetical protein KatS3mg060_3569 [Dehalococcoidia bacterium]|nr:MAG: hypothetical protein KatS3mg060_3569 [Dehalococcoidia bacterium]